MPTERLRACAVWGASRAAAGLNLLAGSRQQSGFSILMYHRVCDPPRGASPPTYNVTPAQLKAQLRGLCERGFQPWPLAWILDRHEAGEPIPPRVFAVTFDDGYENNLTAALPVLEALQVPATLFLATAFLDSPNPFPSDDWRDAGAAHVPPSSWRALTTPQCHELLESGLVELGAHTHTHGYFAGRDEVFRQDLAASVAVLRDRFGIERPTFAFPYGITTPELASVAREVGVRCALTTRFECVPAGSDPYDWGRFNVTQSDTPATLAAKLSGWYAPVAASVRAVKQPLSRLLRRGAVERSGQSPLAESNCDEPAYGEVRPR